MLKKFFFYIISFSFFLIILEIAFSTFFYFKSGFAGPIFKLFLKEIKNTEEMIMESVKIDPATNKMVPGKYLINGVNYSVNSKGFRGNNFSDLNKDNCRIISLGGSITLGVEKSYPDLLGRMVLKKNDKCESLNFGMGSKGLNYVEELFFNEVIGYEPNIVTIMANRNATMYDSYGSGSKSPGIISSKKDYFIYKLNRFLFTNLMTFRFLDLSIKRIIFISSKDTSKIVNPNNESLLHSVNYFKEKYHNQLENIAKVSEEKDIKIVLIKEPYYLDLKLQNEINKFSREVLLEKLIKYQKEDYKDKNILFWAYTNALLNSILDDIQKKYKNVLVVDPTIILYNEKKEKNFLADGNHLTNNGHNVVAQEIFKKIEKYF